MTKPKLPLGGILKKIAQQNEIEKGFLSQKSQFHRQRGNRLVYVYASQATFHQTSKKVGKGKQVILIVLEMTGVN